MNSKALSISRWENQTSFPPQWLPVWITSSRKCSIKRMFQLKWSSPDVTELIVHVPHVVFDVDGHAGGLQHLHGELLREGTNKQSSDSVDAGDLVGHADLFGLVSVLQVQNTCKQIKHYLNNQSLVRVGVVCCINLQSPNNHLQFVIGGGWD